MDVGKRIKSLREMKGITVNKLANMAGMSQSFLRDVELGNKSLTVESLSLFCDALGITIADFFSEKETNINPVLKASLEKLNDCQQMKLADFLNNLNIGNNTNSKKNSRQ